MKYWRNPVPSDFMDYSWNVGFRRNFMKCVERISWIIDEIQKIASDFMDFSWKVGFRRNSMKSPFKGISWNIDEIPSFMKSPWNVGKWFHGYLTKYDGMVMYCHVFLMNSVTISQWGPRTCRKYKRMHTKWPQKIHHDFAKSPCYRKMSRKFDVENCGKFCGIRWEMAKLPLPTD